MAKSQFRSLIKFICTIIILALSECSIARASIQRSEGYIDTNNNGKLYFQTFGAGEPLIVVHGGPGLDQTYFLPQMLELAKTHQVTFYDQRGSGKSLGGKITEKTINITRFIEDLEALRVHLNFKQFTLIGHSWGGRVAMEYSIRYPDNLRNLVLLNSTPATYKGQVALAHELERVKPAEHKGKDMFDYSSFIKLNPIEIGKLYKDYFLSFFYNQRGIAKLSLKFNEPSAKSGMKVFHTMNKTSWFQKDLDLRPELNKLNIPTLIIHGDYDPIPLSVIKEINANIPNSKLVVLKNCGHFPFIDCPKHFFDELNSFLKK